MTPPLLRPKPLKQGSVIGFCAPAYFMPREEIENCAANIEKLGFRVYIHPQCNARDAWIGGSVKQRVDALHDLFADPKIDAIVLTSGGYGCIQLIEHLDLDLIRQNPKIIIGYSDLTVLLCAIQKKCGFVTYHGPNARRFHDDHFDPAIIDSFMQVVTGDTPTYEFTGKHETDPTVITPGSVTAPLNGGNHILLSYLVGTGFLPDYNDSLFFTESNQPLFTDVDLVLHQLRLSGRIKDIKGFILGRMIGHHYRIERLSHIKLNMDFAGIVKHHFPDIPAVIDFPCGHEDTILTFPLGVPFTLNANEDGSSILQQLEPATGTA